MGQRLGRYALFILIFLLTASISACSINPEPKLQWYKTFGEGTDVYGGSVQQTTDGGYVIFGRMFSWKTSPEGGAFIMKADTNGNKLWDKVFGAEEGAFGQSGQQTADGGSILCGTIRKSENIGGMWLIKTDANGDELWNKVLSGGRGNSVRQTTDGGYIICGRGDDHIKLIKTDAEGNLTWDKSFVGQYIDQGNSVQQTTDGGYIVCGWTRPLIDGWVVGKPNVWLIKTDS